MNVSVVIPCHNNSSLLAKTLAGFAAQDSHMLEWEVLLIDNNSADESIASVHRQFRDKVPVSLVQQPQLPHPFALCRARNTGIRLAKGEWIVSMDADTIPNKRYLATLREAISEWSSRSIIATCERFFVIADTISTDNIVNDPSLLSQLPLASSPSNYGLATDRRLPAMKELPNLGHPWDYMHGCNVLYRRKDALEISGYDEAYDGRWGFEDIDFAYRMITQQGCEPLYVPGLQVYHQDMPDGESKTDRYAKSTNPNWDRICSLIPNYKDYKAAKYQQLSSKIKV